MRRLGIACVFVAMLLAACGDSDDGSTEPEGAAETATQADNSTAPEPTSPATTAPAAPAGAGSGTLVLGEETITFDSARCFLQEQDAAAGGGKILFVVQAFGTMADGEPLTIDISRYDEDSQFTGDDILIDIGDPFSGDSVSLSAVMPLGHVAVNGSNVAADGLTFDNFDEATQVSGAFDIAC